MAKIVESLVFLLYNNNSKKYILRVCLAVPTPTPPLPSPLREIDAGKL
jgi:hypothetical protein